MSSIKRFEGRVVIVTGAASGIGAGAALGFLQEGAKVVMADINEPLLLKTCQELKEKTGGEAVAVVADVSKDEDNRRIVETAMSKFGGLHMSFINAGVAICAPLFHATEENVAHVFGANFNGVLFGLKHQIPAIGKTWDKGSIVITSSTAGSKVYQQYSVTFTYACSKAAAEMMMRYGAIEGAPMKVRVNAISPATVKTPMALSMVGSLDFNWTSGHIIDKEITVENVVSTVKFLCSDASEAITGAVVNCDMGASVKT